MTFLVADRIQETTNSPGTGTATLLGAVSGYQSFSTGIGANNTTYYVIADQLGTNWEVGLGALNSTGTVLTRTTVYSSSNGGSTVNFATGLQYVWCDFPSSKAVIQGTAVNFSSIGATTAGTGAFTTLSASSTVSGAGFSNYFAAPPTIGNTTPNAGAFTTLSASGTVSGTGFSTYLASPPAIGGTAAAAGAFTTLSASSTVSGTGFSTYLASPPAIGGTTAAAGNFTNSQITSLGVGTAASATTGEIRATNNVTAFYSSDIQFKENIRQIDNATQKAIAIGGKYFDWKDDYIANKGGADGYFMRKNDIGVIAQDVQAVLPEAVRTREDGTLAVDYQKLVSLAFAAISELQSQIEELKSK